MKLLYNTNLYHCIMVGDFVNKKSFKRKIILKREFNKYQLRYNEKTLNIDNSFKIFDLGNGDIWNSIVESMIDISCKENSFKKYLYNIVKTNKRIGYDKNAIRKLDNFLIYTINNYAIIKHYIQYVDHIHSDYFINLFFDEKDTYYRLDSSNELFKRGCIINLSDTDAYNINSFSINSCIKKRELLEQTFINLTSVLLKRENIINLI